jgi:hypothetical protein
VALKDAAILLVVFFIFLNAVPSLLFASGIADDMNIDPSISGDQNIQEARQQAAKYEASGGFAGTLFQLYASVTGPLEFIMEILFGAELMLMSLGVSPWLVDFVFAPKWLIIFGAIIYSLAGRIL